MLITILANHICTAKDRTSASAISGLDRIWQYSKKGDPLYNVNCKRLFEWDVWALSFSYASSCKFLEPGEGKSQVPSVASIPNLSMLLLRQALEIWGSAYRNIWEPKYLNSYESVRFNLDSICGLCIGDLGWHCSWDSLWWGIHTPGSFLLKHHCGGLDCSAT